MQTRRSHVVITLCAAALLVGCRASFTDDLDMSQFQQAPEYHDFDLSHLKPAEPYTFVSLIQGLTSQTTLAQDGKLCAEATIPANCMSDFSSLVPTAGFGECADHDCGKFFAINRGDANSTAATRPELLAFFGPIDAAEEALIMVAEQGYLWSSTVIEEGGTRAVDGGFDIIATRLTSACDPVETRRYLLHVAPDGSVTEKESELLRSNDGCI